MRAAGFKIDEVVRWPGLYGPALVPRRTAAHGREHAADVADKYDLWQRIMTADMIEP